MESEVTLQSDADTTYVTVALPQQWSLASQAWAVKLDVSAAAGGFGVFESLMDMRSPRATTSLKPFEFRRAGLATSKPG
jgi:hypothetical protein